MFLFGNKTILLDGMMLQYRPNGVARVARSLLRMAEEGMFAKWGKLKVLVPRGLGKADLPCLENGEYIEEENARWIAQFYTFRMPRIVREHVPEGPVVFLGEERCCPLSVPYVIIVTEVRASAPASLRKPWRQQSSLARKMKIALSHQWNLWNTRRSVGHARRLICISERTRKCLLEYYDVPDSRVDVVYPCVEPIFSGRLPPTAATEIGDRIGAPHGFILAISTGAERENFETVLDAYAKAYRQGLREKLVVCGARGKHHSRLRQWIDARDLGDQCSCLGFVEDEVLSQLYGACNAYVDLSLFEGFGLQVAEAMACGAPVIHSDQDALVELGAGGTSSVEPNDVLGLSEVLSKICQDQELREQMSRRSLARSREFRWERFATGIAASLTAAFES